MTLIDFQPHKCPPDEIRDRYTHKQPDGSLCSLAMPLASLASPPTSRKIYAYAPALALLSGWWLPLNNKTEFPLSWKCATCRPCYPYQQTTVQPGEASACSGHIRYHCKMLSSLFSSALNSKYDLYGWNSIRSSLRFPSGEIKVAQAKPIVSIL